ncbi:MAG: diaminopimelate decarboxylase [Streptosporangiaceae bacterium]
MHPIDLSLLPLTTKLNGNGSLDVGGVDLLAISRDFGTPVFVYDVEHLRQNLAGARDIFGDGVAYATKAFHCKSLARLAYENGMSLDVSTAGEYHVARAAGVPAGRLVLHGNNKTRQELERAVTEGVQWIVLDSFDDIDLAAAVAAEVRKPARVLIRINPGVEVHTHSFLATGNRESKFGFPLWTGDAQAAVDRVRETQWLEFVGLHIHVGSLVFAIGTFLSALDSVLDFVLAVDPEVFVVGGGLGVRYLGTDEAPSLEEWGEAILKRCQEAGVRARVLAEPGRSIVAATAVTLYTVGSVATKDRTTYVAVDGGMSDNPRPLLYDSGYEAFLPRAPEAARDMAVTIVGRHCESGDTLVRDGMLPSSVSIGDIVCTPVTGAYGYSMASNYNMMPRPAVVWVDRGRADVVIRRETLDDLLSCDLG